MHFRKYAHSLALNLAFQCYISLLYLRVTNSVIFFIICNLNQSLDSSISPGLSKRGNTQSTVLKKSLKDVIYLTLTCVNFSVFVNFESLNSHTMLSIFLNAPSNCTNSENSLSKKLKKIKKEEILL